MGKKYFLYKLTLTKKYQNSTNWTDESNRIISEHAGYLDELGRKGYLLFAGRTSYEHGDERLLGLAIIKANSYDEAEQLLSKDPAVVKGIMNSELYDYTIAIKHFENAE